MGTPGLTPFRRGVFQNNPANYNAVKDAFRIRQGWLEWKNNTPYVKPEYMQAVQQLFEQMTL